MAPTLVLDLLDSEADEEEEEDDVELAEVAEEVSVVVEAAAEGVTEVVT